MFDLIDIKQCNFCKKEGNLFGFLIIVYGSEQNRDIVIYKENVIIANNTLYVSRMLSHYSFNESVIFLQHNLDIFIALKVFISSQT